MNGNISKTLNTYFYYVDDKPKLLSISADRIDTNKEKDIVRMKAILDGQEEERKRIAKDLHDSMGHLLLLSKMKLKHVEESVEIQAAPINKFFKDALQLLDEAIKEVKVITQKLSPCILEDFGIIIAIEDLCERVSNSSKINIDFQHSEFTSRLRRHLETDLYRIIQELLTNILKHASATQVQLSVLKSENYIMVEAIDNGIGFHEENVVCKGHGLINIETRVKSYHGTFTIDSVKNEGTRIGVEIPIAN